MLNKLLVVAATMLLVACGPCESCKTPREQMNNPIKFHKVAKLFETDGCTVYEYYNKGHWEQFFKCEAK